MGSSSSKLRKYMHNGDEFAAMQLYQSSPELRKSFNPNASYGETYQHNTALHYAARHGMKHLLRTFLWELNGDPRVKNAEGQTSFHAACQISGQPKSLSTQERRTACVLLLLQWLNKKPSVVDDVEKIDEEFDISAPDNIGNTCLHYAAMSGLARASEALVKRGAVLFVKNNEGFTACDLAAEHGHTRVAHLLESFMVLIDYLDYKPVDSKKKEGRSFKKDLKRLRKGSEKADEDNPVDNEELEEKGVELYRGLRAVDLQEAKDLLLVETSDMLNVPLFSAEILLRQHEWSREALSEHWVEDMAACCEVAGIQPPPSNPDLYKRSEASDTAEDNKLSLPGTKDDSCGPIEDQAEVCDICTASKASDRDFLAGLCGHRFCQECWSSYLKCRIVDFGYPLQGSGIPCPAFDCPATVPPELVQRAVSPSIVRKYLQHDIQAFVESHPMIKWCPRPGCNRAVRIPNSLISAPTAEPTTPVVPSVVGDYCVSSAMGTLSMAFLSGVTQELPLSHAVDCGTGHYFCWECLGEAHAPIGCEKWHEWQEKCADIDDVEVATGGATAAEEAANSLWLVTNAKPCPNCHSPIQKNDGCNHMKCSKCKHEFCWVCLDSWKRHNAKTGGYFHCTRVMAVANATAGQNDRLKEAAVRNLAARERSRFLRHLAKYRECLKRLEGEKSMMKRVKNKAQVIAAMIPIHVRSEVAILPSFRVVERKKSNQEDDFPIPLSELVYFLESAVKEILKARQVLCGAYAFSYFLEDRGYNRMILDFLVSELHQGTDKLSTALSGAYIQTPLSRLIEMTAILRQRRRDLLCTVARGLNPPDTPPALRRMGFGTGWTGIAARNAEMQQDEKQPNPLKTKKDKFDPNDPWVKDNEGRHTNWLAVCDWSPPEEPLIHQQQPMQHPIEQPNISICQRPSCEHPRAVNSRTGTLHQYCSRTCQYLSGEEGATAGPSSIQLVEVEEKEDQDDVNLLIALEMSRLQALEDDLRRRKTVEIEDEVFEEEACAVPPPLPPKSPHLKISPAPPKEQTSFDSTANEADNEEEPSSVSLSSPVTSGPETGPSNENNWTVDVFLKSLTIDAVELKNFCPSGPPKEKVTEKGRFLELKGPARLSLGLRDDVRRKISSDKKFSHRRERMKRNSFVWPAPKEREGQLGIVKSQPCSPRCLTSAMPRIRIVSHSESSQDLESETGIPRSPTLFISGVAISRSSEASPNRSPSAGDAKRCRSRSLVPHFKVPSLSTSFVSGGNGESTTPTAISVTVTPCVSPTTTSLALPASPRLQHSWPSSPTPTGEGMPSPCHLFASSPGAMGSCFQFPDRSTSFSSRERKMTTAGLKDSAFGLQNHRSASDSQCIHQLSGGSEAPLSSVLLVEESTLSSDDFHEALFFARRRRRRKSSSSSGRRRSSKKRSTKKTIPNEEPPKRSASGTERKLHSSRRSSLGGGRTRVSRSSGDLFNLKTTATAVSTCA